LSAAQPSNITIRLAVPADAAAIRDLTRAAYAKWIPLIGREPLPMTVDYDRALRMHRFALLFADDRLAALVETVDEGDHWLIENLAVHPDFQGRGFGERMLTHAENEAAESANIVEMRLYTNQLFAGNIRFYRARGYHIDREEPFKGGFLTHMSKRIGL
jgi:ribosomal protein S18 acetylase RimI-like enzyme